MLDGKGRDRIGFESEEERERREGREESEGEEMKEKKRKRRCKGSLKGFMKAEQCAVGRRAGCCSSVRCQASGCARYCNAEWCAVSRRAGYCSSVRRPLSGCAGLRRKEGQ